MLRHFTLTCLSTLVAMCSYAQISIVSTDLTSVGDQITRYIDTIPSYGPGSAGVNVTWDFSAAVIEDTANTTVVSTGSTPYASTFSSSDYAMTADGTAFLYFTHSSNQMTTTGAAGDLLGTGEIIEAPFSNALVLHNFPREYGNTFDDVYAFEAEADGSAFSVHRIRINHTGHVYDTTDGYGTLITPTGTYEALRVKTVDYTTDVIDVQLFSFPAIWTNFSTEQDTSISYSWHAKDEKLAIAEMSFDSIGNPAQFTFSAVPPVVTIGIEGSKTLLDLTVYPNPSSEFVFLKSDKSILGNTIEIHSVDGKLIDNSILLSTRISVSELENGLYIIRLRDSDGVLSNPVRFMVQH